MGDATITNANFQAYIFQYHCRVVERMSQEECIESLTFHFRRGEQPVLPEELVETPISQWDVSRVTNMSRAFEFWSDFNEPLNDWDVSNVVNMSGMFRGCFIFNQPLNRWNVGKVANMSFMFADCNAFFQPLTSWEREPDDPQRTNIDGIFDGTNMIEAYVPTWMLETKDFNELFRNTNYSLSEDRIPPEPATDVGYPEYNSRRNSALGMKKGAKTGRGGRKTRKSKKSKKIRKNKRKTRRNRKHTRM
jgi:surface protein